MSNLALYRKYRSKDFDEVVGQSHIVDVLKNAITSGRHSHAYLLTGPRGVGKTTVARLIAKSLNGLRKDEAIADHLDIVEIDGASNRGIDEIRNLKEKIQLGPARLKYKVYIIDEVHMLTKEAFNALLKTLEEPPAHAVFIFATTEVHKLPETIISRTQRFDFRPINASDIVKHLDMIAKKEKIDIDKPALELIARLSRGGFRDAISLLDQLSATQEKITLGTVTRFSGLLDDQKISELLDLTYQAKSDSVLVLVEQLYKDGADPSLVAQQLLDTIKHLLVSESKYPLSFLVRLSQDLSWVQTNLRFTTSPQLVLQVGLVRSLISPDIVAPAKTTTANQPISTKVSALKTAPSSTNNEANSKASASEPAPSSDEQLIKALSIIKNHNNSLYALLMGAKLTIDQDNINVACRFSFHRDRISEQRNRQVIEKVFSRVYKKEMHLNTAVEQIKKTNDVNSEQELMSSAISILGAEVIDG